ncbi:MAG TPA: TonB-dependent receptor, partial [Ignavibacteriaceae bacterium]|nr:TonB-dependent receptor [Ignavibacteriaceae bacterium]
GAIQPKNFTGTAFETWFNSGSSNVALSDFIASGESRDIYNLYSLNPLIDKNRVREWHDLNKNGIDATGSQPEVWDNPLEKYDDYEITERVGAGYIMNTLNISQKLTIIAGLRVEDEDNDYLAKYMTGPANGFPIPFATIRDTTSSSKQTIWLPNVNISYRPVEFMTIRLAGYKALARPDFSMRLDRYTAGRPSTSGAAQVIYVGNPNLKTAQAWNYEVNTSFYGNEIGLISVSAYYKEIKDFFHLLTNFNTAGNEIMRSFGILWPHGYSSDLSSYNLVLPYNAPKPAKVWGFEFEHQINFHFLPGLLKNIVLSYNASFVRSLAVLYKQETIISRYDTLRNGQLRPVYKNVLGEQNYKLEGMPEFFGNVSLGYDIGGFSGRISMFHKAVHDSSFSATGLSDRSILEYPRFDLSLKQQITDIFSIFLNVSNITDARDGFELQSRRWDRALFYQDERYGRTAEFGMTVEL